MTIFIYNTILATDDCNAVGAISNIISNWGIKTYGSCYDHETNKLLKNTINPREELQGVALKVFADIEMLRKGKEFFGLFQSNLVRMIHRLRYPYLNHSHSLASETYSMDDANIRNVNDNLFNIWAAD